jgi:hypothetical protein
MKPDNSLVFVQYLLKEIIAVTRQIRRLEREKAKLENRLRKIREKK